MEECLAVGFQYTDREGAAKERLLVIIDSESKKGVDTVEEILRVLRKAPINKKKKKLTFQCHNCASNMRVRF